MSSNAPSVHEPIFSCLKIFDPASLTSEEDIATAVTVLEGTLDDRSTAPIVRFSLQPERPHAFEFMISSLDDATSTHIVNFVLNEFPAEVCAFRSSLGYEIATRLSHSLSELTYPSYERSEEFDDRCHQTRMAPTTLEDLSMLLQSDFFEEAEIEGRSRNRKAMHPSKGLKRKAATGAYAEINERLSQVLGSEVLITRESAEKMIKSIVDNQKDTLKFFFTLLRRHEIKTLVINAYFRGNVPQGALVDTAAPSAEGAANSSSTTGGDPIQADLHFPSAAGFGQWRIFCSRALISDITRNNSLSKAVLRRLRELSLGCFSETNQKRLTRDSPTGIDIFRARLPGGTRLVYIIDVVPEFGRDNETQVLKIFGLYSMDKLNQTDWEEVGRYRAKEGREYISKCKARKSRGGFYYDPMIFDAIVPQIPVMSTDTSLQDQEMEDIDEIHRLFDLEQYSFLSQNVIRDILEGHEYHHVFQVSREEKKIIEFTKSSFVLGRSGTGKTTVIIFKILGIERAWQNRGSIGPRPRQLFLTTSQLLANKVENEYVKLLFSLYRDAGPDTPQYVHERIQHWNSHGRNNVLDLDGAEGTRDDLPQKFSELQDRHFPLFITVDTLWSLLEADMNPPLSNSRHSGSQQTNNKWLGHTDLVTFDVFKRVYWRHLPQTLTKSIVPSVAFSDIIGTIKGSEKSLELPNRALDRGTYESLTNRNYALFEAYQKLKRDRRERDLADRTHDLLDGIKEYGLKGVLVDFVYVDEVQDILLIDARLIISLCRNPDGFLWAGDTAQTISIGSTFSFKELGAFVYRYQRLGGAVRGTPTHPKDFQLLVNYRSHGGIVNCANAIIQQLQRFPGAIDVLQPEAGVIGKSLPLFFHGEYLPSRERDFFLLSTGRPCMLGSEQCIIVRDEAARKKFMSEIGHVGIILSLFNSKGLEFDDVILYNFFGESVNPNLWRHLTDAQLHPLEDLKHAPLIHELKSLYVAVTRARHRLWIVDYSDIGLPIKRHLLNRGLVLESSVVQNPLESFVDQSTSVEWYEAGLRLMNHGEFDEASMAFENAEDVYMKAVAVACRLREVARDIPESATKRRREAFVSAARAFETCAAMADNEEECSHYVAAARCYAEIKYHREVLKILKREGMYTEAATYCFDNNMLNDAVSLIKTFQVDQETTERIKQVARISYFASKQLQKAAGLFRNEEEQMEFVVEHELGEARAVMLEGQEKYGEAVQQYLEEGQESEALELALEHIDEITQDSHAFNAIVTKILWRYLSLGRRGWPDNIRIPAFKIRELLTTIPLGELRIKEQKLIYLFRLTFVGRMSTSSRKTLASHILRGDPPDPLDRAFKLLALDLYFDDMPSALDGSSQSGIVTSLHLFYEYSLLMREGASDKAPWDSTWLSTLLQIERDGEDIRTKPGTLMYDRSMRSDSSRPEEQSEYSAVSLSRENFSKKLNRLLWKRLSGLHHLLLERLNTAVSEKDHVSSHLSIFDPCTQLTLYGTCRLDHFASHYLDEHWFNRRVRFRLQHIMILDNIYAFGRTEFPERIKSQRRLLGALENALNPLSYLNGSISSLNKDLIPEAADGFVTVQRWAFDVLYSLNPSRDELQGAFLTNLYKAFTLARLRQGRAVGNCLFRIPSAQNQQHPRLVVRDLSGHQVYMLRDFLAFMDGSGDLAQGIKFFRYMVQNRLPVDPAVLCTIVERLFGLTIMTARHRGLGSLHGVLLPRSWILALWEDFFQFKDRSLAPLSDLALATEKLLMDIYTGEYQKHAVVDPWNFTLQDLENKAPNFSKDIPLYYIQDLCVARICRCFCLLAENFSVYRKNVVEVALSLPASPSPESRAFHGRYINCWHWEGLAKALYQSTTSPFDRLVRLRLESSLISGPKIPGVDLVTFRDTKSIPSILQPHPGDHPTTTIDSRENAERLDAAIAGQVTATDKIDGTSDQHVEGVAEYSADDAIDIGDGEGPDRSREALLIQRAARRYLLKGMEGNPDDRMKIGRDRFFKACKASSSAVHPRYRKIYLGLLPHLLLCLEWIISSAQASKRTIKARRAGSTLQELSDLTFEQTQMIGILKEAHGLRNRLEPGSTLHIQVRLQDGWDAERDLEPLRNAVIKVRDLLERLSDPKFPALEFPTVEFELAWNGIMPFKLRK